MARQFLLEVDAARTLDRRQVLPAVLDQLGGEFRARLAGETSFEEWERRVSEVGIADRPVFIPALLEGEKPEI